MQFTNRPKGPVMRSNFFNVCLAYLLTAFVFYVVGYTLKYIISLIIFWNWTSQERPWSAHLGLGAPSSVDCVGPVSSSRPKQPWSPQTRTSSSPLERRCPVQKTKRGASSTPTDHHTWNSMSFHFQKHFYVFFRSKCTLVFIWNLIKKKKSFLPHFTVLLPHLTSFFTHLIITLPSILPTSTHCLPSLIPHITP